MAIYVRNEQGDLSALQIPAIRGKSAYEIAQANGFKGTEQEWLQSLKGENGGTSIDDTTISTEKTWSSSKIEDFVHTNDGVVWSTVQGENLSVDYTKEGKLREVELWGNTIQNENNLEDIQNLGIWNEEKQGYEIEVASYNTNGYYANKNKFDSSQIHLSYGAGRKHIIGNNEIKVTYVSTILSRTEFIFENLKPSKEYRLIGDLILDTDNNNGILSLKQPIRFFGSNFKETQITNIKQKIDLVATSKPDGTMGIWFFNQYFNNNSNVKFNGDIILTNITIAENVGATELSESKSSKTTILLPCQLMKVGNVADRLYWDDEKGKYVVEKNIDVYVLDGSNDEDYGYNWSNDGTAYPLRNPQLQCKSNSLICNKLKMGTNWGIIDTYGERITLRPSSGDVYNLVLTISNEKTNGAHNVTGLREWLKNNNLKIFYQPTKPQLIETNITEPILLSCYKNKTHLFVTGGIDGNLQIKAPLNSGKAIQNLTNENKTLKETNKTQDLLIDTTMLATDELFIMLEPMLSEAIVLNEKNTNKMVDFYVNMVQRGLKNEDEISPKYKEQVKEKLNKLEH